jgi:RNA polymerase sigma-70 factor (ECF subfamily)
MDSSTHYSLFQQLRDRRDGGSWTRFVNKYRPLLFSYVKSKKLNDHDAEDLVQDILMKLLQALRTFEYDRTRGRFRTWLWKVTSNKILDKVRRDGRKDELEKDYGQTQAGRTSESRPDKAWEEAFEQRAMEWALQEVRAKTDPRTWACFEEHKLRFRPTRAVAAELGLSESAVNANSCRVLKKVKEKVLEYHEEAEGHDAVDLPLG